MANLVNHGKSPPNTANPTTQMDFLILDFILNKFNNGMPQGHECPGDLTASGRIQATMLIRLPDIEPFNWAAESPLLV
jgi:hypothetical protein